MVKIVLKKSFGKDGRRGQRIGSTRKTNIEDGLATTKCFIYVHKFQVSFVVLKIAFEQVFVYLATKRRWTFEIPSSKRQLARNTYRFYEHPVKNHICCCFPRQHTGWFVVIASLTNCRFHCALNSFHLSETFLALKLLSWASSQCDYFNCLLRLDCVCMAEIIRLISANCM